MKTIVISGGTDMTTAAGHARDLVAAIAGAIQVHRPTAGHMLLQDTPQWVSAAINYAMGLQRQATRAANATLRRRES